MIVMVKLRLPIEQGLKFQAVYHRTHATEGSAAAALSFEKPRSLRLETRSQFGSGCAYDASQILTALSAILPD